MLFTWFWVLEVVHELIFALFGIFWGFGWLDVLLAALFWWLHNGILCKNKCEPFNTILLTRHIVKFEPWLDVGESISLADFTAVWAALVLDFLIAKPTNKVSTIVANCFVHTSRLVAKTTRKVGSRSKRFRKIVLCCRLIIRSMLNKLKARSWQCNQIVLLKVINHKRFFDVDPQKRVEIPTSIWRFGIGKRSWSEVSFIKLLSLFKQIWLCKFALKVHRVRFCMHKGCCQNGLFDQWVGVKIEIQARHNFPTVSHSNNVAIESRQHFKIFDLQSKVKTRVVLNSFHLVQSAEIKLKVNGGWRDFACK